MRLRKLEDEIKAAVRLKPTFKRIIRIKRNWLNGESLPYALKNTAMRAIRNPGDWGFGDSLVTSRFYSDGSYEKVSF